MPNPNPRISEPDKIAREANFQELMHRVSTGCQVAAAALVKHYEPVFLRLVRGRIRG